MIEKTETLAECFQSADFPNYWRDKPADSWIPESYAEVKKIYERGYAEGIEKISSSIDSYHAEKRKISRPSVSGGDIDIPAFIAGLPECFIETIVKPGSHIKVYVNLFMSAGSDCDSYYKNMGTLLGILDDLEQTGVSSEIIGICTDNARDDDNPSRHDTVRYTLTLNKNCLSDIAIIAHRSFIRRIFHSALAWAAGGWTLYNATDAKNEITDGIYIENMMKRFWTQEEREKYFIDKIGGSK